MKNLSFIFLNIKIMILHKLFMVLLLVFFFVVSCEKDSTTMHFEEHSENPQITNLSVYLPDGLEGIPISSVYNQNEKGSTVDLGNKAILVDAKDISPYQEEVRKAIKEGKTVLMKGKSSDFKPLRKDIGIDDIFGINGEGVVFVYNEPERGITFSFFQTTPYEIELKEYNENVSIIRKPVDKAAKNGDKEIEYKDNQIEYEGKKITSSNGYSSEKIKNSIQNYLYQFSKSTKNYNLLASSNRPSTVPDLSNYKIKTYYNHFITPDKFNEKYGVELNYIFVTTIAKGKLDIGGDEGTILIMETRPSSGISNHKGFWFSKNVNKVQTIHNMVDNFVIKHTYNRIFNSHHNTPDASSEGTTILTVRGDASFTFSVSANTGGELGLNLGINFPTVARPVDNAFSIFKFYNYPHKDKNGLDVRTSKFSYEANSIENRKYAGGKGAFKYNESSPWKIPDIDPTNLFSTNQGVYPVMMRKGITQNYNATTVLFSAKNNNIQRHESRFTQRIEFDITDVKVDYIQNILWWKADFEIKKKSFYYGVTTTKFADDIFN